MGRGFVSNRRDVLWSGSSVSMLAPTATPDAMMAYSHARKPIALRTRNRDAEIRGVVEPSVFDIMAGLDSVARKRVTLAFI